MTDPSSPELSCLTADLVASRKSRDRAGAQARLEEALRQVNRSLAGAICVPFSVTLGDEWQGLLSSPAAALEADFLFRRLLHPLPIAAGVGTGGVSTPLRERTALMDGPCFHRAREALDRAKERRGAATVLASDEPLVDEAANALCLLLHGLASRWTETQFRSLEAYLTHGTEAAAARALGVTQPTLHQSLDRSQAKLYLEARDALLHFAAGYPLRASPPGTAP
ncbi:MAG: hypothetical protein IH608_04115 [Proteobacteria bacterium]|nr:hypothetical protein [Pseudomonadota bacterium]